MATKPKGKEKPKGKRFITPVFRASFPNLFVARRSDSDDPNSKLKFGVSAIWTPAKFSPRDKELYQAILKELDTISRRDFKKPWKELPDNIKRGLRNGSAKEGLAGYGEGTRFANLTSNHRPGVILSKKDEDGNYIKVSEEEGNTEEIYPGCYMRATVNVYSYGLKPGSKGKGVAIGLFNVQKVKDGERLDNRVAAEDDFDEEVDSAWLDESDDFDESDDADDGDSGDDFD